MYSMYFHQHISLMTRSNHDTYFTFNKEKQGHIDTHVYLCRTTNFRPLDSLCHFIYLNLIIIFYWTLIYYDPIKLKISYGQNFIPICDSINPLYKIWSNNIFY